MTLDPETVRRHIERALETHEHGDSCEAPECCSAGDPVQFGHVENGAARACSEQDTGRLPTSSRRGGPQDDDA